MINPKPRFGYDEQADKLYDYVTARNITIGEKITCDEGVWDTERVKELILAGKPIEGALGPNLPAPNEVEMPTDSDEVEKFKRDADAVFAAELASTETEPAPPVEPEETKAAE